MKRTVTMTQYQPVPIRNVEVTIPEEPCYFFKTGIRKSIAVIPQWTTWQMNNDGKPEEVWEIKLVSVGLSFENTISTSFFRISELEGLFATKADVWNPKEAYLKEFLKTLFLNPDALNKRTEEQFMNDFNATISNCNRILGNTSDEEE